MGVIVVILICQTLVDFQTCQINHQILPFPHNEECVSLTGHLYLGCIKCLAKQLVYPYRYLGRVLIFHLLLCCYCKMYVFCSALRLIVGDNRFSVYYLFVIMGDSISTSHL